MQWHPASHLTVATKAVARRRDSMPDGRYDTQYGAVAVHPAAPTTASPPTHVQPHGSRTAWTSAWATCPLPTPPLPTSETSGCFHSHMHARTHARMRCPPFISGGALIAAFPADGPHRPACVRCRLFWTQTRITT